MSAREAHHQTVLVADDNEANRDLLCAVLSAEGYQVVCAADGQQALEKMDSDSIDLALLDVVMPRPTGFESLSGHKIESGNSLDPRRAVHWSQQRFGPHPRNHVRRR